MVIMLLSVETTILCYQLTSKGRTLKLTTLKNIREGKS